MPNSQDRIFLLTKDTAEYIRRTVRDMYALIPPSKIVFQGGFRVFGVDMDRKANKTFLDYNNTRRDHSLSYESENAVIPEEAKKLIESDYNISTAQMQVEGKSIEDERAKNLREGLKGSGGDMNSLMGRFFSYRKRSRQNGLPS